MKTVTIISLQEWDELVAKEYGKIYSFQQQDGCQARSTVYFTVPDEDWMGFERETVPEVINGEEMGVSFSAWLARSPLQPLAGQEYNKHDVELWWERNFYPSLQSVANDLHQKGILAAGEYGIEIDW